MRSLFLIRLPLLVSILAFACNAPFAGGQPSGGGGLTALADSPALLSPAEYANAAVALAAAIAELNRAQSATIAHLRGTPSDEEVDADLIQVGAAAMTVAQLAEQLARSTANQAGGGETADKAARPYLGAAQVGYLIAIETQNMREEYKAGAVTSDQLSDKVAEGGQMLWSADEFDPSVNPLPFADARLNPSSAPPVAALAPESGDLVGMQIGDSSGKGASLSAWSSSAGAPQTVRVTVPAPRSVIAGDALDPALLNQLRTPEGQSDADMVRAVAGARLASLGAMNDAATGSGGYDTSVTVPVSLVFLSQIGGRSLPYFEGGTSSATAAADSGGPLVSAVRVQDGQPMADAPFEVDTDTPLVTLIITNAAPSVITSGPFRNMDLTVSWQSALGDAPFTLACYAGSGGSASTSVSGATGEAVLTVGFSHLRDTAVCHARLLEGAPSVGISQVIVLDAEPGAQPPAVEEASPIPPAAESPAPPASEVPPPTVAPEPSATPEEALPPAGTSTWFVGFGGPAASGECPPVPLESESTTMNASEDRSTLLMTASGGDATFTRTGGSTYTWSDEGATMTVTFTSATHAEGDYVVSAEGCSINWPTTWDKQ